MDELDRGNTLSSLLHMLRLRWHRLTRDIAPRYLNNGIAVRCPRFAAFSALPPVKRTAR